jgi:tripartite-type tricarboxylate transporter receptor subunit TctC
VSALHVPERRMQLEGLGFEVLATTSEQFTAFVKTDMAKWARQLKAAGIQPE